MLPMMNNNNSSLIIGTVGGTISSMYASIQWAELLYTVIMAIVGALCSYSTSYFLQKRKSDFE